MALTATVTQAQTILINPAAEGGFESGTTYTANGWSVVNYAAATRNNWVLGTAAPTGYSGSRAGYISNNSAATPPPYAYDNATSATVHLYRDVVFPAGETLINFSFSEIQTGETGWDRMLVFISNAAPTGTPATGTPSSNTATLTGYTLLATTSAYSAWTTVNVPITAAQAAVANQQGCRSAVSNNSVVTVNPVPSAAISYTGPVSFCQGANLTLSTPTGTGLTYVWRRDGNPIVGATSATYTADSTGAYTVTVTNSSTCSTTTATPVNITVVPAPAATITASGTTSFCVGGSVVLSAPVAPAGVTYTYVWRDNNVAVAGQTAQTFTVNSSRNVTVTVTNTTTNCSATTPVATVVTVGPPPPAPISSALTPAVVCAGQSVRLRTNNAGGLSYQWKLGGVDVAGAIDSFLDATAAGNYTVVVSAGGPTCASTSAVLPVTVNALPNAAITASGAPTVFCQGGSV
ncbi:PKD domain protein, partial [Ostertagia ostertagi]